MKQNLLNKLWLRVWMIVAVMTTALAGTAAADVVTLVSGSGTSGYAIPDGWTSSGTVEGGSYLKFDNGTITSPEFAPHTGLSFTYTVATFGSGTNHPLQVKILDASTEEVIFQTETATPTSSSYISTGSPLSLGDVSVPFKIQLYGSTGKGVRLRNYSITGTPAGGGSSAVATTTTIDASGITNTDVYAGTEAGSLAATVKAGEETINNATVTWSGGNDEVATIDATTGAVTLVSAGTVTFTATFAGVEDEYKSSSDTYELTVTDTTPVPTHTATFSVNGVTSTQDFEEGAAITFPDDPADVSGKTFVGWVAEAIDGTTNEAPTFVTSATMGEADITYYAVFAFANGGGSSEVVDVLNRDLTGVTGTSYAAWSGKTSNSDAVYAGNSAGGNESIQLRSSNNNSGIVTTTSGGKAKKVSVTWASNTTSGRILEIFGSNTAYSSASLLYNAATWGNKLGEITYGTSTELAIADAYEYIGIRSKSGALYLDEVQITWSTGGGVTYSGYCTTVVAAAVARPTIEVAENPFVFSTTATITCETEGAAIKYSFDGETWNDYTDALTITATTTLYAKAVKDENESEVASVTITKSLAVPTVAIDATGITNTNVYEGTEAGSLAASVTYNDAAVEGATVTWSGNNDAVATIDAATGAVTLVAAGTVTFTATYAGNDDFAEKTATYEMTVTNSDPNAPGSENNPYTVAEAIAATPASGTSANVYIKGVVSGFFKADIMSDGSNYRYYISDDGTTDNQLLVYKGKGLNNVAFSSADDLQIGDEVVIFGGLTTYSNAPEVAANNYIVSLVRVEKPAAPTFSVAEGTYTVAQSVELSTTTEGATIYYTVDDTEPTAESTEYTEAIVVTETTTIKAIAVKDDVASEVATATYTINTTPSIELGDNEINASAEGTGGVIIVTYNNITEVESEVFFCDAEGNAATYDWVAADINGDNNVEYVIEENTSTEARTAYMKVYALDDNAEDVYSELITINQAGFVVDFATLPFAWNGGTKDELTAETGVTANGLGSDYAASNAPYRVKLDGTGDYIQVKTDCQPVIVSVDVKMLGGGNTSTITVQESADGETFTDVEDLSISGSQNTVLYLQTANAFDAATRYIRLYFTKGSNVGLGGIAIEKDLDAVTVGTVGYATYVTKHNVSFPSDVEAYITSEVNTEKGYVSMTQVTAVPKGTPVVLKNEGTFTLAPAATDALADVSANELKASDTDIEADGSQYVLAKPQDQKIGFYKATGFIAPGKAYLQIEDADVEVKGFTFKFDDDATAIDEIVNGKLSNGKCYNLAGQRVSKMQRGINIVNGKKILK